MTLVLCRLCSETVNSDGCFIFGDDGKKNLLQMKIKIYLHISVSEDDELPKVMCNSCFKILDILHRFATMALCMQDRLRSRLGLHALDNAEVPPPLNLFHSVTTENSTPEEEKPYSNDEVMEMEVNVDPMSILGPEDDESDVPADFDDSWATFNYTEQSDESPEIKRVETQKDSNLGSGCSKVNRKRKRAQSTQIHILSKVAKKPKPHVCKYCDRSFILEYGLRNHLWSHENPRSTSTLKREQRGSRNQSNGEKTDNVSSPGEQEPQTESETEEQNNKSDAEVAEGFENNLCGVCRKSFKSNKELVVHLESHYSEGKFGCSICCRVFWSIEYLEKHRTKHDVKHFTCKECKRVYSTKGALRQHLVTHSNARPHKCSLCPKTFKRNQDLKFHYNQHTGARPYLCPHCPKSFASSGNCFSHRKRMHPEETKTRSSSLVADEKAEG